MGMAFEPYFKIDLVDLSDNTTVAPAGQNLQSLQPPQGFIYQIIDINYLALDPSGSTSGTHELIVSYQNMTLLDNLIQIVATTGTSVAINKYGFAGDSAELPSGATQQYDLKAGGILYATYDQPLDFLYNNDTDVNQTASRRLEIMVKIYKEAV